MIEEPIKKMNIFENSPTVLTESQLAVIELPLTEHLFLTGAPGTGKTTVGLERCARMIDAMPPGKQTLVITPIRSAKERYLAVHGVSGRKARVTTYNSFIQHSLNLFWPLIAAEAGFPAEANAPLFLTIETAQILMQSILEPMLQAGRFDGLQLHPSRLYNQIKMTMNKMAMAGFPYQEYATRMKSSWTGDGNLLPFFDLVQSVGIKFKALCRRDNLLDYAMQLETFATYLMPHPAYRRWLQENFAFLVCDNVEEDVPLAHDFFACMRECVASSLLIMDSLGGFRNFMGGDPLSADELRRGATGVVEFDRSFVSSVDVSSFSETIEDPTVALSSLKGNPRDAYRFTLTHFYPKMIKDAARDIAHLVYEEGLSPSDIVVIAPLASDVFYTMFERELRIQGLQPNTMRTSKPFVAKFETQAILTLLTLLHPSWNAPLRLLEVAEMLRCFIPSIDPIRAQLFAARFVKQQIPSAPVVNAADQSGSGRAGDFNGQWMLLRLDEVDESKRNGFAPEFLRAYEVLQEWVGENRESAAPPDRLLSDFFHQILTQDGFSTTAGRSGTLPGGFAKAIASLSKYRLAMDWVPAGLLTWNAYIKAISDGMVSAYYAEDDEPLDEDTLEISLASGFVARDRSAKVQVWINAGSPLWWERYMGVLTNDVVLSRAWKMGDLWGLQDVYRFNNEEMVRLVRSLLARCRSKVYVYASELNESGLDQKSNLMYLFAELGARFAGQSLPEETYSGDNGLADAEPLDALPPEPEADWDSIIDASNGEAE